MHQVGNQSRLYYDARSTNHQDVRAWLTAVHSMGMNLKSQVPVFILAPHYADIRGDDMYTFLHF